MSGCELFISWCGVATVMSLLHGQGGCRSDVSLPRDHAAGWSQRRGLDHRTALPPCTSPHLPTSRLCPVCPSKSSLRLPDCGDPLGTSPPTEVLNQEAAGFLKNKWVWGVCEAPGIVDRAVHSLFVGEGPELSSILKEPMSPDQLGTIIFLNEPPVHLPHSHQLWESCHLFMGSSCDFYEPWSPRDSLQFQQVATGISSHAQRDLSTNWFQVVSGPFLSH